MQRRPLAQHLAPYARIVGLVRRTAPAQGSLVTFLMQLPLVWMACRPASARSSRIAGASFSLIQWNCRFWRVVKWPYPLS